MPSLTSKLVILSISATLSAVAGLMWMNRAVHRDEMGLAEVAGGMHLRAMDAAEGQAAALVAEAKRSAALVDGVRRLQMHFQRQVLAFKHVLLRGERPDQHSRFTGEFESERQSVEGEIRALRGMAAGDADATVRLDAFAAAHAQLTASYRNAWAMIELAETWGDGQHRADDYMVGRDVEPLKLLDALTATLLARAEAALVGSQRAGAQALHAVREAGAAEMEGAISAADERNRRVGLLAIAVLLTGSAVLVLLVWRKLRPIRTAAAAMDRLAAGDLSVRLTARGGDEIARLASAYNRSMDALHTTLGSDRVDWQHFAVGRREAAGRLGSDLGRTTAALVGAGRTGAAVAQEIDAGAQRLAGRIEDMGGELQRGAAGVEELTASLAEVAANAKRADDAVARTNALAGTAATSLAEFDAASQRVAEAVELIGRIAKQVNLLALNATIESARAGEHGRGFTVVAGEVKALARRTGEAAGDIAQRIAAMRSASERTASEVAAIRDLMREAAALVREVGQAVEQQAATTREMSSAIGKAAGDGRELGEVAAALAGIAQRGSTTADTTRTAAAELERLAADLRSVIGA